MNNEDGSLLQQFENFEESIKHIPQDERFPLFKKFLDEHPDICDAAIQDYKAKNPDRYRALTGESDDPEDIGALLEELARTDPEGLKEMLKKISSEPDDPDRELT